LASKVRLNSSERHRPCH